MTTGEKFREWMIESEMTTMTVAQMIGTWPPQVSRIMNSKAYPTLLTAFRIEDLTRGAVRARDFYREMETS